MAELAKALPWVAVWAVIGVLVWTNHQQYMAGHDTLFFGHKTPEERRIREAVIRKLELEAEITPQGIPRVISEEPQ